VYLQEEEEGSEDDSNVKPDFTVTLKTDFSARSFLDQLEDDADGFISPVDHRMPSKCSQDTAFKPPRCFNLRTLGTPSGNERREEKDSKETSCC
jgi:hypothetical protein